MAVSGRGVGQVSSSLSMLNDMVLLLLFFCLLAAAMARKENKVIPEWHHKAQDGRGRGRFPLRMRNMNKRGNRIVR